MPSWDELTESRQMARILAVGLACLVAGWQVITVAAAEARYTREGFSQLLDAWQAVDCR